MIEVTLPNGLRREAVRAGEARYLRRRGTQHRWNRPTFEDTPEERVNSIGAEMAVALVLDRTWQDTTTPDQDGDVGPGVQVRWTHHEHGRLPIHPSDDPTHCFFLVTGSLPTYRVHGWIRASDAQRPEWWVELRAGRPCWAVPQLALSEAPDRREVPDRRSVQIRGPYRFRCICPRSDVRPGDHRCRRCWGDPNQAERSIELEAE